MKNRVREGWKKVGVIKQTTVTFKTNPEYTLDHLICSESNKADSYESSFCLSDILALSRPWKSVSCSIGYSLHIASGPYFPKSEKNTK